MFERFFKTNRGFLKLPRALVIITFVHISGCAYLWPYYTRLIVLLFGVQSFTQDDARLERRFARRIYIIIHQHHTAMKAHLLFSAVDTAYTHFLVAARACANTDKNYD